MRKQVRKYRGKEKGTKKIAYGYLVEHLGYIAIIDENRVAKHIHPKTVNQLVCVNVNGIEIYEEDLFEQNGFIYKLVYCDKYHGYKLLHKGQYYDALGLELLTPIGAE